MQDYYGAKELFQSKQYDTVPDRSLNGKCDVKYGVADYNDVLRGTPAEDDTWYTRYRCSFSERADGSVTAKGHSSKCDQGLHPGEGDESGLRTSIQPRQIYVQMLKM